MADTTWTVTQDGTHPTDDADGGLVVTFVLTDDGETFTPPAGFHAFQDLAFDFEIGDVIDVPGETVLDTAPIVRYCDWWRFLRHFTYAERQLLRAEIASDNLLDALVRQIKYSPRIEYGGDLMDGILGLCVIAGVLASTDTTPANGVADRMEQITAGEGDYF